MSIREKCDERTLEDPSGQVVRPFRKEQLAVRFGCRARHYDRVTPLQRQMGDELLAGVLRNMQGKPVRRILELGCGSGALTSGLREMFPESELNAVDISAIMIEEARGRVEDVNWICRDAEVFAYEDVGRFDLIISNATVQWFEDPLTILMRYRSLLTDTGLLAVATFGDATFAELRNAFASAYRASGKRPRQHVLSMKPYSFWRSIFPHAETHESLRRLVYPDVRAFLKAVKLAGASYTGGAPEPLNRAVLARMSEIYRQEYPDPSGPGILVTYHVVFLYCARHINP